MHFLFSNNNFKTESSATASMAIIGFKIYCQNMACGVLELCLIATQIEGFKSVLPKYGMRCT
jgi:hypothetical protein